jgi:hypothetical protein
MELLLGRTDTAASGGVEWSLAYFRRVNGGDADEDDESDDHRVVGGNGVVVA